MNSVVVVGVGVAATVVLTVVKSCNFTKYFINTHCGLPKHFILKGLLNYMNKCELRKYSYA